MKGEERESPLFYTYRLCTVKKKLTQWKLYKQYKKSVYMQSQLEVYNQQNAAYNSPLQPLSGLEYELAIQ